MLGKEARAVGAGWVGVLRRVGARRDTVAGWTPTAPRTSWPSPCSWPDSRVAVLLGRRERRRGDDRVSRWFAVAIPLVFVPTQVVELATRWDLDVSVPLHLCDLAWVAAAAALWTQDRRLVTLTLPVGAADAAGGADAVPG